MSADKIVENTATVTHGHYQMLSVSNSTLYTWSAYFKAAERTSVMVYAQSSRTPTAIYNLSTGTVTSIDTAGDTTATATITPAGNGWYRCTITATTVGTTAYHNIAMVVNGNQTYAGNGFSGLFVWGVQFEAGSFATSYIPTTPAFTSRASSATYFDAAGVLRTAPAGGARYGYELPYKQVDFYPDASNNISGNNQIAAGTSGALRSQGLILEPAATNLVTYSYNMSTANTGYYQTTINAANFAVTGETTAPDNTYTASKFVFTGTNDRVDQGYGTVPSAGWYTLSVWLKGVAGTVVQVSLLTSTGGNVEPAVYLTGQWQKFSVRKYFNVGEVVRIHAPIIRGTMGASVQANTGETGVYATYVYVWGLQIESGYVATSYIPTYGATATRAADVSSSAATTRATENAEIKNLQNQGWYNTYNSSGTLYAEGKTLFNTGTTDEGVFVSLHSGISSGEIRLYHRSSTASINLTNSGGTDVVLNSGIHGGNTLHKAAGAFATNDFALSVDGNTALVDTANAPITNTSTNMGIGTSYGGDSFALNGHIKKIVYYPKRLSNTQLQALTV